MPLARRMLSIGPINNTEYQQLRTVAKANGHESPEDFVGEMVADIATDEDGHIWIPIAMTQADYDFAVGRWGDDFRGCLDQTLGHALDLERLRPEVARQGVEKEINTAR